jgi:hypothetical protein
MSWGIVAGAAVGLVGSAVAADGAQDAADTQAAAAGRATDAQRQMFDKQVELQAPWRTAGERGLNMLENYLGTSKRPDFMSADANAEVQRLAMEMARARVSQQQTAQQSAPNMTLAGLSLTDIIRRVSEANGGSDAAVTTGQSAGVQSPQSPEVTEADLEAAYAQVRSGWGNPGVSPEFGSLMKNFGTADFQADPGYEFRKSEQEKALQRAAAASGGLGSGKFLKDAMRFSGGLADQTYGAAFDRFNVQNTNRFNRLASLAGIGQTAANQTGAAAGQFGSQIGSNIIGAGNAMAAGQVGAANAINGGLSQGLSMYQQNKLMNSYGDYRYKVPTYEGAEY